LVAKPGQEVSEAQIRTQLHRVAAKGIMPRYGVPEQILFVEALPRPASANSTRRCCENGTPNKGGEDTKVLKLSGLCEQTGNANVDGDAWLIGN
jgi:acyl-coenzyme A synthetase/AMP-(fatty) acid ligase